MKGTLLAAAAALALAIPGGMAIAQETTVATDAAGNTYVLTAEQKVMYDGWPADRRISYDAWPDTYKTYYWTLTPDQQTGWWALNAEQRGQVYAMTPEQRIAAWASITAQMSGAAPTTTGGSAAAADMATASDTTAADAAMSPDAATPMASAHAAMATTAGNMQFVRREITQPVAASADAAALASGEVPVCKKGQQDGCINGWEKNKTGNKPLNYWPGKPASEIPGPKPESR